MTTLIIKNLSTFFRYSCVGLISFTLDISLFALFYAIFSEKLFAMLMARLISGGFNFYQNKYRVYRSLNKNLMLAEAIWYAGLAMVTFCVSYAVVVELMHFFQHIVLIKMSVDILLFLINFVVQKYLFNASPIKKIV